MSMSYREAINRIKDHMEIHHIGEYPHIRLAEALEMAISALVEKENVGDICKKCLYSDDSYTAEPCCKCTMNPDIGNKFEENE